MVEAQLRHSVIPLIGFNEYIAEALTRRLHFRLEFEKVKERLDVLSSTQFADLLNNARPTLMVGYTNHKAVSVAESVRQLLFGRCATARYERQQNRGGFEPTEHSHAFGICVSMLANDLLLREERLVVERVVDQVYVVVEVEVVAEALFQLTLSKVLRTCHAIEEVR